MDNNKGCSTLKGYTAMSIYHNKYVLDGTEGSTDRTFSKGYIQDGMKG